MRALRSSKTPDRFWFLDTLPRTETGKLLRRMVPGMISQAKRGDSAAASS
jgi:acyl-coenzyme A synthetase/AMP-(fatty) acid ligase